MGFGGDIKEENTKLKEKIEKELQPEIDRLIKENTSKKNNEEELQKRNKELQNQINNYKKNKKYNTDLSPEYIQKLMEENAKMSDEIFSLKKNLEETRFYCINLLSENNKLKLICGQYQLMLLSQNKNPLNNNINNNMLNSWRTQINNLINKNPIKNSMNNNNFNNHHFNKSVKNNINSNFNNNNNVKNNFINNQDKILTIIFNFENRIKFPIVIFPRSRLMEIFSLVSIQIENCSYSNIYGLTFFYNSHDITSHFLNNDEVSKLNLSFPSPIIEVIKKKNF